MQRRWIAWVAAWAMTCAGSFGPACAQAPAPDASAPCELHVWPSADLVLTRNQAADNLVLPQNNLSGAAWGGFFNPNVTDEQPTGRTSAGDTGPLTMARQIALLRESRLAEQLHLAGYRTVVHDSALAMSDARQAARLAPDTGACHAELVLIGLTYARVYAQGHNLKLLMVLRDFGTGTQPLRRVALPVETRLTVPTDEKKRTDAAFVEALEAAYIANLHRFGQLAGGAR